MNVKEMLHRERERGLHHRMARIGEGKDSMMHLCKSGVQA
jgi:hypothetical protein